MTRLIPASSFDWEALTALYNRTRSDYLVPMQMTPDKMAEYARIYDVSLDHSFVALDAAGDPVGVGMLGVREGRAWITRLGVLPTQRGKGTARRIVDGLIEAAWDTEAGYIQLEFITGNHAAGRLFASAGFVPVHELAVMERSPWLGHRPAATPSVGRMTPEAITAALAARSEQSAWTAQTESLLNAGSLTGWQAGESWVICQRGDSLLTHFALGPVFERRTMQAILVAMDASAPAQRIRIENIAADDPMLPTLDALAYGIVFRRTEMLMERR